MILVNLKAGLANRLRTLLAFYQVALVRQQLPLKYVWTVDRMCNGGFKDLFELLPGTEEVSEEFYSKNCKKAWTHFWGQGTFHSIVRHYHAYGTANPNSEYKQQLEVRLYRQLCLRTELLAIITNLRRRFQLPSVIGLHVRRTDHLRFAQNFKAGPTSDDEFFHFIDKYPSSTKIYLATDNASTQEIFRHRYGQRIMVYQPIEADNDPNRPLSTKETGRAKHRRTTLDHAIIDLYLLASCRAFKGSRFSSFSELAQTLGHCARSHPDSPKIRPAQKQKTKQRSNVSTSASTSTPIPSPASVPDSQKAPIPATATTLPEPPIASSSDDNIIKPVTTLLIDMDENLPIYFPPHPDTVLSPAYQGSKYDNDYYV